MQGATGTEDATESAVDSGGIHNAARLVLEIDVGELLAAAIAHDEAGGLFFDRLGRREAACRHSAGFRATRLVFHGGRRRDGAQLPTLIGGRLVGR
jgi:hypothetical protein